MIVCIAARMGSSRLPGKAMKPINGKPMIQRLFDRVYGICGETCLCTTEDHEDDILTIQDPRIKVIRGDILNVAQRFLDAADRYSASHIVRVTGDNPLTDPWLMKEMIRKHLDRDSDYTYCKDAPKGTKSEIIKVSALSDLYDDADPDQSEFMTYDLMTLENKLEYKTGLDRPDVRLTVDTVDDLRRIRAVYREYSNPPGIAGLIDWYDKYEAQSRLERAFSRDLH